jgi:ATP-binding cassette subfamily F protein 3
VSLLVREMGDVLNAIRDAVATDIIHQHSGRLDYYKGCDMFIYLLFRSLNSFAFGSNFNQFYATKTERDKKLRKEYDTQMEYRKHLQAFIDRWRYNANRGMSFTSLPVTL